MSTNLDAKQIVSYIINETFERFYYRIISMYFMHDVCGYVVLPAINNTGFLFGKMAIRQQQAPPTHKSHTSVSGGSLQKMTHL